MKKTLLTAAIMLFTAFGSMSFANVGTEEPKVNITEIKHPEYNNVLKVNLSIDEPISYVFLRNSEGEILFSEKVNTTSFSKKFSLNVDPTELEGTFSFEFVVDNQLIKYDFIPAKIFRNKK